MATTGGRSAPQRRRKPGPPGKPLRLCEPLHPWTRGAECAEAARLRHRASIRPLQPRTRHIGPGRLINPARTLALHNGGTGPASSGIAISRRNESRRAQRIAAARAEVALLPFQRTDCDGKVEGRRSNALALSLISEPLSPLWRDALDRPRRVGGCRSCRCRRTFPSDCATGPPTPRRSPTLRRS